MHKATQVVSTESNLGKPEANTEKCSPRNPAEQHSKNRVKATLLHRRQTEIRIQGMQKKFQLGKI